MWASYYGRRKSVKYLIKNGANVNARDSNGKTVLMWAAQNGDKNIVKLLIDKGADIYATDIHGNTAFMCSN